MTGRPLGIAVDSHGYLYVAGLINDQIEIYAPNASGPSNPVGLIQLPAAQQRTHTVFVDPGDHVFIAEYVPSVGLVVDEFATPLQQQQLLRTLPLNFNFNLFVDATRELYFPSIAVRSAPPVIAAYGSSLCCANNIFGNRDAGPDRYFAPNGVAFTPVTLAVEGRHAFVLSAGGSAPPSIITLDIFAGNQTPLSVVTGSNLASPVSVALGL